MVDNITEDELAFGKDHWVYCNQHMRPHTTGWCTVDVRNKVGLGIQGNTDEAMKEAYSKCREWKFKLYKDIQ